MRVNCRHYLEAALIRTGLSPTSSNLGRSEGVCNSGMARVLLSSTPPEGFCCPEGTTRSFIPLPETGLGT